MMDKIVEAVARACAKYNPQSAAGYGCACPKGAHDLSKADAWENYIDCVVRHAMVGRDARIAALEQQVRALGG